MCIKISPNPVAGLPESPLPPRPEAKCAAVSRVFAFGKPASFCVHFVGQFRAFSTTDISVIKLVQSVFSVGNQYFFRCQGGNDTHETILRGQKVAAVQTDFRSTTNTTTQHRDVLYTIVGTVLPTTTATFDIILSNRLRLWSFRNSFSTLNSSNS